MGKLVLGKVKGETGKSVHLKYNTQPTDEGAQDVWQTGMKYIGIAVTKSETAPETGYTWVKFVGDNGEKGDKGEPGATFLLSGSTLRITLDE